MIEIKSSAFQANARIPEKYTGEGPDTSPALEWSGVPKAAKEFALICDDPDAPRPEPFVHWVIYGIPPDATGISEGLPQDKTLKNSAGAVQGINSFDKTGYNGPMPPKGHGLHHYHFRLYALDKKIELPSDLDKMKLLASIKKLVLEEGELVGTYSRE